MRNEANGDEDVVKWCKGLQMSYMPVLCVYLAEITACQLDWSMRQEVKSDRQTTARRLLRDDHIRTNAFQRFGVAEADRDRNADVRGGSVAAKSSSST